MNTSKREERGGVLIGSDLSTTIERNIALPTFGGVSKAGFIINDTVVTVDNASNTGVSTVTISGVGTASTGSDGCYGVAVLPEGNTVKASQSVTFIPNIPLIGRFESQARWTTSTNRETNIFRKVTLAPPIQHFTVNQTTNGDTLVSLETYNFTAGNVQIANASTNGYVVADACGS